MARAIYTPGPTEAEAARFGLTVEEASGSPIDVWPEHLAVCNLFIALTTQWRVGMAGATGLDYAALPAVMSLHGIPRKDRLEVFEDLRVLERAVLDMKK